MHELEELRQKYDRLSNKTMPTELRNRIYGVIDEHRKANQDNAPRSRRRYFGWVKSAAAIVAAVCVTAVITVEVMKHATPRYTTAESVENAVQHFINTVDQPFLNKYKPGTVEKVTHNIAMTPYGDFVATQTISPKGTDHYSVFYVSQKDGKWKARFTGFKYKPQSNPLPVSITMSKDNGISSIGVGVPKNLSITKVICQVRFTKNGKYIPISLTKVGSLPIWVYNLTADKLHYPTNGARVWLDSITAYDQAGNVVWSSNLNKTSSQTDNTSSDVSPTVSSYDSMRPSITPPNAGLVEWNISASTEQQIHHAGYGIPINAFYLPLFITKGDSYVGVESMQNMVTFHFKDMTLVNSPKPITPSGTVAQSKVITLPVPFPRQKITVYTMADKRLILSMQVPLGTHIMLSSASISLSQLETILQSIHPLAG